MSFIGAGGSSQTLNLGRMFILLKPRDQRPDADAIIQELRPKLTVDPGHQGVPAEPPGDPHRRPAHQEPVPVHAAGRRHRRAVPLGAAASRRKLRSIPGLQDVTSDLQIANPQVTVEIDRDKAAALGVTPAQIEDALYTAYGQRQVSTIYTPTNQYWVILEVEPQYQADPSALSLLYVRSATGALVPLDAVRD